MDPTALVDVRLAKELITEGTVKLTLLGYVENLLNFTNDLYVNSQTGQPWEAPIESNNIAYDQLHDPARVDKPRIIKVGLSAKF